MNNIRVSAIMAVFREKEKYVRKAVESVLSQTFADIEFIIILDDPNNKHILSVLKEYQFKDSRVTLFVNDENIGLAQSLNRAISCAEGEFLARMDADDIALPERFSRQVSYLDRNRDVVVVGTNKYFIDQEGHTISKGGRLPSSTYRTEKMLQYVNIMLHPSVMMRRREILNIGGYRNFPVSQDYELWGRILDYGYKINNINEYLMLYRVNPEGISSKNAYMQALMGRYIKEMREKRKSGRDDGYSEENLQTYIELYGGYNMQEKGKFQIARDLYIEGWNKAKKGRVIKGINMMRRASSMHPLVNFELCNIVKLFWMKFF